MKYYHEVGMGYSRNITDRLRIGIKGKLLFGIADVSIDNGSLGINVNNDYTHLLDADLIVNISGPVTIFKNSKTILTVLDLMTRKLGQLTFFQ